MAEVERARGADREIAMAIGIARAVGGDAEGAVAEDPGRGDGEKGAVDAAAVGDEHGSEPSAREPRLEGRGLGREAHSSQSSFSVVVVFLVLVVVVEVVLVVVADLLVVVVVVVLFVVGHFELDGRQCR